MAEATPALPVDYDLTDDIQYALMKGATRAAHDTCGDDPAHDLVPVIAERDGAIFLGIEFRFNGKEAIEYRGWGGSVQKAIEYSVMQRQIDLGFLTPPSEP